MICSLLQNLKQLSVFKGPGGRRAVDGRRHTADREHGKETGGMLAAVACRKQEAYRRQEACME